MMRGNYCQQVMSFFFLVFDLQLGCNSRVEPPFLTVWIRPCTGAKISDSFKTVTTTLFKMAHKTIWAKILMPSNVQT